MIVDYYFKNKKLNESCHTLLVELIINDLIKKNRTMTIDLASHISNAIIMSFPTEIKVRTLLTVEFFLLLNCKKYCLNILIENIDMNSLIN